VSQSEKSGSRNQNQLESGPDSGEAYTPPGFDPVVHRALYQSWVGRFAAIAIFASLVATIDAIVALAMLGRSADYIQALVRVCSRFCSRQSARSLGTPLVRSGRGKRGARDDPDDCV
jgi:hypothetical protein